MGFDTGGVDGIIGVKSSSALLMFQYYKGISNVTGKVDATSYNLVRSSANSGTTYNIVKSYIDSNWSPGNPSIQKDTIVNGYLDTDNMVRISTYNCNVAYLDKQAAISWAVMVNAARLASMNVNKFGAMGTSSGYRSYHDQIEAYIDYRHGGNIAACPYFAKGRTFAEAIAIANRATNTNANNTYAEAWIQSNWNSFTYDESWNDVPDTDTAQGGDLFGYGGSPHGWGLAVDMMLVTSTVPEHTWLIQHSEEYGFSRYQDEFWHWEYAP